MNKHGSMNRIFRLVWNDSLNAYVPAAETARGRGKSAKRKLVAAALSLTAGIAQAGPAAPAALTAHAALTGPTAPTGGQVTSGSGTITQSGSTTTIQQSSQDLSLNWQTFNIAPQETVDFVQPNATAIAVNQILGSNGSVILGHLDANGQVYLINPNGVIFGKGAEVNVGGLVASTLNLVDGTLGDTSKSFSGAGSVGAGSGSIVNDGTLTAASGGSIALLGNHVTNNGVISAQLGTTALGAGSAATLTFSGTHLVSMQIDQSVLNSVAANGGLIRADGGQVLMTAGAKNSLLASVVNNTGIIEARTLENHEGTITLLGGMRAGTVNVAGKLDASAPSAGNGGNIETSAAQVRIASTAKVTSAAAMGLNGSWLIDPTDFTIAASGGDETGAQLSSALGSGNVQIQSSAGATGTSGDINVNDTVAWSANTLTLSAQNNININSALNGSGTASLALKYGQGAVNAGNLSTYNVNAPVNLPAGPNFSTQLGSDGTVNNFTVITQLGAQGSTTGTDLQGINGALGDNYALGANIDATATASWNSGAGFSPIDLPVGGSSGVFTGVFDGLGHTVSNLTIFQPYGIGSRGHFNGLFSTTAPSATIRDVGLVTASVYGDSSVGGLVGGNNGSIVDCYVTGSVTSGWKEAGGLVATNFGTITRSYSSAAVASYGYGRLIGSNVGGLVGVNEGTVTQSYSNGSVYAYGVYVGGLVGNNTGAINNSYSTASVNGHSYVGGLVGNNYNPTSVNSSGPPGNITNSYSAGTVTSNNDGNFSGSGSYVGGFLGNESGGGTVTNSFWDTTTSGRSTSSGAAVGMTTQQMQASLNFTSAQTANGNANPGWDLSTNSASTSTWFMYEGDTYPLLRTFMTPLTVTATNASTTYNATAYSGGNGYTATSVIGDSIILGSPVYGGSSQGAIHAGSYAITVGGLYSDQQGYVFSYANGTLIIKPAPLTVSGTAVSDKVYDGTSVATLSGGTLSGFIGSDTATLIQTGAFASKDAGTKIAVTATDTVTGAQASDYTIIEPTGLTGTITPATLTVSGTTVASKVYNGTTVASLSGGSLVGLFGDDSVTLTQAGNFASKNVGTGIPVTAADGLGGAEASDYTIVEPTGLSGTITPATLTVSGTLVGPKVYNGTTAAALSGGSLVGVVGSDTVTLTEDGSFANKNVGTGIAVSAGDSIGGASAGDYVLVDPTGLSGTITPATLTVSGTTVGSKIYNGTNAASLMGGSLVGLVSGDTVTLDQSGLFASASAGTGIAVTATDSLGGASAEDYRLVEPTGLHGTILPATNGSGGSGGQALALSARTQIVENFIYPQLGANPQVINASPTLVALATSADDAGATASTDTTGMQQALVVNVSMKIGANGTLKIENGGLRLPGNLVVGNE